MIEDKRKMAISDFVEQGETPHLHALDAAIIHHHPA